MMMEMMTHATYTLEIYVVRRHITGSISVQPGYKELAKPYGIQVYHSAVLIPWKYMLYRLDGFIEDFTRTEVNDVSWSDSSSAH